MDNIDREFENIFGNGDPTEGLQPQGLIALLSSGLPGFRGTPITGDEVEFNDTGKLSLPQGWTFEYAMEVLTRLKKDSETVIRLDRQFRYRANDGAHATTMVLKRRYGLTFGEAIQTLFGDIPPETRSIDIGPNKTLQVPWGHMSIPSLKGVTLTLCDHHYDSEYGQIFDIHVESPKKHKDEIEALFDEIELELKTNSIFRGKAVVGTDSPEFLDLSGFNSDQIVYSDDVTAMLEGTLWAPIRYTQAFREEGISLKRSVLLYGPYGTGKTSVGQITADIAQQNGWTFISARAGRDDIEDVLRTARLYQPAVVLVEDVDNQASSSEDDEVSRLLEAFDGITSKGGELVVVMTTNHLERIHKGMLRPGRLDAVIEITSLDRNGCERLIKAVVPSNKLANDIDFDAVYASMDGFFPAFVREALERAKTYAIARLSGQRNYVLSTTDLVSAAKSLHPQLKALNEAEEGEIKPNVETALGMVIEEAAKKAVHGTRLTDRGVSMGELTVPSMNGNARQ